MSWINGRECVMICKCHRHSRKPITRYLIKCPNSTDENSEGSRHYDLMWWSINSILLHPHWAACTFYKLLTWHKVMRLFSCDPYCLVTACTYHITVTGSKKEMVFLKKRFSYPTGFYENKVRIISVIKSRFILKGSMQKCFEPASEQTWPSLCAVFLYIPQNSYRKCVMQKVPNITQKWLFV